MFISKKAPLHPYLFINLDDAGTYVTSFFLLLDSKGRAAKRKNLIHATFFLSAHLAVGPRLSRGEIQYTVCALFYYLPRLGEMDENIQCV